MAMPKKRILVVDDVEDIRDALASVLIDCNYDTFSASNSLEAMEVLQTSQIDMVITDILMPVMDGIELVKNAQQGYPNLKFIIMSGGGRHLGIENDYIGMSKELTGISCVLKKPIQVDELLMTIEELFS